MIVFTHRLALNSSLIQLVVALRVASASNIRCLISSTSPVIIAHTPRE